VQDLDHCKRVVLNSLGSAISFASPSLQTKLTDGYAAVGNIEEDSSRTLHLKTAGPILGAQCRR